MKSFLLFLNAMLFNPILKKLGYKVGFKTYELDVYLDSWVLPSGSSLKSGYKKFSLYPIWDKKKARTFVTRKGGLLLGKLAPLALYKRGLVMFSGLKILSLGDFEDIVFEPQNNFQYLVDQSEPHYVLVVREEKSTPTFGDNEDYIPDALDLLSKKKRLNTQ
jgi:hypothetical protein